MRGVKLFWLQDRARKTTFTKRMNSLMKKTRELTILCDIKVCIVFFNPEEDTLMVWPTHEAAKTLTDRFYSLSFLERSVKGVDLETYIQIKNQKIEKKLADDQNVNMEYDMDHLIYRLQGGCNLDDLSQTEIENLVPYIREQILWFRGEMGSMEQDQTNVEETDETPRDWDDWNGLDEFMEIGTNYHMDKWVLDDQEDVKPRDETDDLDLKFEPSDADEDKKVFKGDCSKVQDDAE